MAKLDRELGLEPRKPFEPKLFPELVTRVRDQALFHELDACRPLVEIGRFEALECLGEGGFGCVFKAHDPVLDRLVAVKLCPVRKPGREERLKREARALAKLKHRNIIAVHDAGWYEEERAFYIVTEYVRATNLHDYAVKHRLPWELVFDIFMTLGQALATAHENGVVHGDFKPANVILDLQTRVPYIVDFGLARIMATEPEEVERYAKGGTLHYMAPELLRGGSRDELSDQYAFCASLWLCIDGHTPYVGDTTDELLGDIEIGEPLVVSDAVMPQPIREVLEVGLRASPDERYPDMRTLLDELMRARGPMLVPEPLDDDKAALEPGAGDHGEQSLPKGPRAKGLSLISGIVLLVASLAAFNAYREHSNELDEESEFREQGQTQFEVAMQALREGDRRTFFEAWTVGNRSLRAVDPRRAGMLSRQLAESVAMQRLDESEKAIPAWVMIGAAESFERAEEWKLAIDARERAAEMLVTASMKEAAKEQRKCQDRNKQRKRCGPSQ